MGKRNAKVGELGSRGADKPIEKVGVLCQNRGGVWSWYREVELTFLVRLYGRSA